MSDRFFTMYIMTNTVTMPSSRNRLQLHPSNTHLAILLVLQFYCQPTQSTTFYTHNNQLSISTQSHTRNWCKNCKIKIWKKPINTHIKARSGSRIFNFYQRGGWGGKFWKKMFINTRINAWHMKTRQTCNCYSLLLFQQYCLLFFALFYYSLLFLKLERGGGVATPVTPL